MATKLIILVCCALWAVNGSAYAGPCSAEKDAGSGPTSGHKGQTSSTSEKSTEHPPTSTMNRATAGGAASPQDVKKQTEGKPTAAQQAEGAKSAVPGDGC